MDSHDQERNTCHDFDDAAHNFTRKTRTKTLFICDWEIRTTKVLYIYISFISILRNLFSLAGEQGKGC